MICFLARHRLGAYLDGALDGGASRALADHLESCWSCRGEIDSLRRVKLLVQQALPAIAEPDWSGFWPGIVRGIQDGTRRRPVPARSRRSLRWVLSGVAAAAVAALSVGTYQYWSAAEDPVVVTAANTQYPGGTMVYHTPEKMAVVWVFDE